MTVFKRISVNDAQSLIEQTEQVNIVDIRDENSFAAGRMQAALHLDNANLHQVLQQFEYETPLIVCCYHGNSSQMAAQFLIEQGFEDVYSLDGGFEAWAQSFPHLCER